MNQPVTLFGPAPSSYVRTARLVCEEKQIPYALRDLEFGSSEHRSRHPYARVPCLEHGELRLWETQAIARYLDEAFPGPSLTPDTAAQRGRMEQWISALNCYIYPQAVAAYALRYIFPGEDGPDQQAIAAAVPAMAGDFAHLDRALAASTWLVGEQLTLADLFVFPAVGTAVLFPEGRRLLAEHHHLARALAALAERPSWSAVTPSVDEMAD